MGNTIFVKLQRNEKIKLTFPLPDDRLILVVQKLT